MGEAKRREELGLPPREKKKEKQTSKNQLNKICLLYTSPSPRDTAISRMPSSA